MRSDAIQVAVNLLSRREHSAKELKLKLLQRGFSLSEIESALRYCQAHDFQNDQRFVEQFCRSRMARGYGIYKIEQALKRAGIEAFEINRILRQEQVDWCRQASVLVEKNAWKFQKCSDKNKKIRFFLMAKGYPLEVIQNVLREKNDADG